MKSYFLSCVIFYLTLTLNVNSQQYINSDTESQEKPASSITRRDFPIMSSNKVDDLYREEFERVLRKYNSQLDKAFEDNDEIAITRNYYDLAWWFLYRADFDIALNYFIEATKYKGEPFYLINSYGIASNICSWTENDDQAMKYAQQGLMISEADSILANLKAQAKVYVGDAHKYADEIDSYIDNYKEANIYFKEARDAGENDLSFFITLLHLATSSDNPESMFNLTFLIKYRYEQIPEEQRRLLVLSLFKLSDSFLKLKDYEAKREKQVILIIAGLLIFAVISFFLWMQNRAKKKMNRKLQILNTQLEDENHFKASVLGILNHDLRHPVIRWINYLQLREKDVSAIPPELVEDIEKKSLNMSLNLLRNMDELLIWSKNQMLDQKLKYEKIEIKELFENIKTFFRYEDEIDFSFEAPLNLTLKTSENYLIIIMRNLTANAINALHDKDSPTIKWKAVKEKNLTILSVQDNGCGISKDSLDIFEQKKTSKEGLGLQLVKDFAQKIGCKIEVTIDNGTIFRLIFENEE